MALEPDLVLGEPRLSLKVRRVTRAARVVRRHRRWEKSIYDCNYERQLPSGPNLLLDVAFASAGSVELAACKTLANTQNTGTHT